MNTFRVEKAFLIGGHRQETGSTVQLDDIELARQLLSSEKITPGDEATSSRWQQKTANAWKAAPDNGIMPGRRY